MIMLVGEYVDIVDNDCDVDNNDSGGDILMIRCSLCRLQR